MGNLHLVKSYKLEGYENTMLATLQDAEANMNQDLPIAGEVAA